MDTLTTRSFARLAGDSGRLFLRGQIDRRKPPLRYRIVPIVRIEIWPGRVTSDDGVSWGGLLYDANHHESILRVRPLMTFDIVPTPAGVIKRWEETRPGWLTLKQEVVTCVEADGTEHTIPATSWLFIAHLLRYRDLVQLASFSSQQTVRSQFYQGLLPRLNGLVDRKVNDRLAVVGV